MPIASSCSTRAKSSRAARPPRSAAMPGYRRSTLALLELKGVSAGYGRARVLFDVSLKIEPGEVVMLAGRNGAGKSTTLKAVMGLVERGGEIRFNSQRVERLAPFEGARLGVGYVPEDRRIFAGLTGAQNREVGGPPGPPALPAGGEGRVFAPFPNLCTVPEAPGRR